MSKGIIIFGLNGSGKSTLGRALAKVLGYKYMAIEAYHFKDSEIPYTIARSHYDCQKLIESDITKHGNFIITAVKGAFSDEICSNNSLDNNSGNYFCESK